MPDEYLDVAPDQVVGSGHSTAATSNDHEAWATRAETALRAAAGGAGEAAVSAAFEGYLSEWNPALHRQAALAEALGTNAVSAGAVIANADSDAAAELGRQGAVEQQGRSHLNRPITS